MEKYLFDGLTPYERDFAIFKIKRVYFELNNLMRIASKMSQAECDSDWIGDIYHTASFFANILLEYHEDELDYVLNNEEFMKKDGSFEYFIKTINELNNEHKNGE